MYEKPGAEHQRREMKLAHYDALRAENARLRAVLDEIVHRTAFEPWSEGIKLHMTFAQMDETRAALAQNLSSEAEA